MMLARLWTGCALGLVLTLGCSKTETPVATTTLKVETSQPEAQPPLQLVDDAPEQPEQEDAPEIMQAAGETTAEPKLEPIETTTTAAADDDDEFDELSPKKEAELLAKLAKRPDDAELLLKLASFKQEQAEMTDSGELDYGKLKQSADYIRRALKADKELTATEEVKAFVAAVFFNEACALSLEKQDAAALTALRSAVDYGWSDLTEMQTANDLAHLRKNPNFSKIVQVARDKRKRDLQATISALFIGKPDFNFDFALEDSRGKPVAKKDFAGKILIVNIWGTWCPPCRRELPDLIAAYKKYQTQGVEILGINTEPEDGVTAAASIRESQKTFGINYRCALGDDELFKTIPNFDAVPMTLFFNREGTLQAQWVGQLDEMVLEMIIERLLQQSPSPVKTKVATKPSLQDR